MPLDPAARCAAHPARPAAGICPSCGRPFCAADRSPGSPGCALCRPRPAAGGQSPPVGPERWVRAALAAYLVAVLAGPVYSQYVDAPLFAYLAPAVIGALAASAAGWAVAGPPGRDVRAAGAIGGLVGVALGFLVEGSRWPLAARSDVLVPYLVAAAVGWLWPREPRPPRPRGPGRRLTRRADPPG